MQRKAQCSSCKNNSAYGYTCVENADAVSGKMINGKDKSVNSQGQADPHTQASLAGQSTLSSSTSERCSQHPGSLLAGGTFSHTLKEIVVIVRSRFEKT